MSLLSERIKECRNSCGYTLLEVAERLGISEATMQRYESGEIKNIKHNTIVALASIFEVEPSYLMGWEDSPAAETKKAVEGEITLDYFEYALFGEVRELDDEEKQELLRNAQRFNELRKLRGEQRK